MSAPQVPIKPVAQKPLVLAPPTDADGNVVVKPRLDIATIASDPSLSKQRDLLVLAWDKLLYGIADPTNPRTFFQIGGIHGWPYVAYNSDAPLGDNNPFGYCWHGSQLFPTWHRPYVALLEQELRHWAKTIASEYTGPDAAAYAAAAEELRMPFWDWLANDSQAPALLTDPKVTVNAPTGSHTLANPLAAYRFPKTPVGSGYNFHQWINDPNPNDPPAPSPSTLTRRQPLDGGIPAMNAVLKQDYPNRVTLWSLLLRYDYQESDWHFFADHFIHSDEPDGFKWKGNPILAMSIEQVHDKIHVDVGGTKGQMSYPEVAGLDPIFFFHHCQVDRLLAQWQAAHPLTYVEPREEVSDSQNYLTGTGQEKTGPDYPLHPFRSDTHGGFWSSAMVRDTRVLGYTYDTLQTPQAADEATFEGENEVRWLLVLPAVKRFQYHASFTLLVFFYKDGTGPSAAELVAGDSNLKALRVGSDNFGGSMGVFTISATQAQHCSNCQRRGDLISGAIDVTAVLERIGLITADTPADAQLTGWEKMLRVVALDANGAGHADVQTGTPTLFGISKTEPGLDFFDAHDPPVSGTATS
ncbi:hypothetical protein WJX72_001370 [[Myrmecia] bisecta]|uniref:Tyrosinase copper-binding domain-containing protein n=1 Tax=[Myrmecia] bisecta TaxID=41462 RepID=A0AAW1PJY0_9CHLO